MNRKKALVVKKLCKEMILLIDDVILESDRYHTYDNFMAGTKLTGELRRKSMDLTRKLAELRRPW